MVGVLGELPQVVRRAAIPGTDDVVRGSQLLLGIPRLSPRDLGSTLPRVEHTADFPRTFGRTLSGAASNRRNTPWSERVNLDVHDLPVVARSYVPYPRGWAR